jgi:uncharacterized protein (PEP-CTERM system associated)
MGYGFFRKARKRPALCAGAASAALLACGALVVAGAAEARQAPRDITAKPKARPSVRPYVRLQEIFTDNAALSAGGGRSDFITRALAGVAVQVERSRLNVAGRVEYAYDWYARQGGLNGGTTYGSGSASYNLLKNQLWIDADGTVSQAYESSSPVSGVDRAGTPGRTQLEIYRVGPRLAARLGGFADLVAAVRSQWVSYTAEKGGVSQLPPDSNILQALGRIDTTDRFSGYQLLTSASYVRDDHDYRAASAVQSAYLRVLPKTRLIGRAGYERIRQSGVVDLSAPVLSVGIELSPNATSRLTVEGGQRYERTAWNAKADVRLGNRLLLTGEYYETLSPSQVYVANSFERFVEQTKDFPAPVVPQSFSMRENIYNQTTYNKVADFHVIYGEQHQSLDVSGRLSRRKFVDTNTKDTTFYSSALYTRHVRPDVDIGLDLNYSRTFDSPVYGEFETYAVSGRVLYRLNSTTDFSAGYHYMRGTPLGAGADTRENLFRISLEKRF